MAFKLNSKVKVITPIIQGKVVKTEYNEQDECLKHLVEFVDGEGETHQRWYNENELEEAKGA